VTSLATAGRKVRGILRVRRICGVLPVLQVARLAVRRQPVENSDSGLLVTVFALHSRVRTKQWKPVLVILHLLCGDGPTLHRVAFFAIRAHLPAVYIAGFVAVRAVLSHIREDRLHVTLHARNFFVHAAQGIISFVVIELRNCTDGPPTCRGVTVLTRDCEGPVRTTRGFVLRITRCRRS